MIVHNSMNQDRCEILGVGISRLGMDGVLAACKAVPGGYVCFANVHSVTESGDNHALMNTLNGAFLSVADGLPLVWVSRLMGRRIASRVCGPDFMARMLADTRGETHGFIGGRPGQAEIIAERFGVRCISYVTPLRPFGVNSAVEDWWNFLVKCPGGNPPKYIWVGLGAPKQELWMNAVSVGAAETLFFGVGAAFDFLSGTKERAPAWMQKSGLEWFYRLTREPGRLWKRYLETNSKFVWRLLTGRG